MTAPLLAVGIGNTMVKFGLTHLRRADGWPIWAAQQEIPTAQFDPESLLSVLPHSEVHWQVASVQRSAQQRLQSWVESNRSGDVYRLLTHSDLPIQIRLAAPQRVGLDRLAAAVAVNQIRDRAQPAIVIDAGTAITVNLLSADGAFEGGVILPGFGLTAKALAMGTDQLPHVAADLHSEPPRVVGKSTEEAIRSGLFWGNVGAVREIVDRVQKELGLTPPLYVTGGDARRLAAFISAKARFIPDLVLAGVVFSTAS